METKTKTAEKTQGVKTAERNPSVSYTIKSFKQVIQKLEKLKAVTKEEADGS